MIDLHAHTDASDGSLSPEALVARASELGLEALGICDHDTLAGYELAVPAAAAAGLELICGVELSTRHPLRGRPDSLALHLLGYFLSGEPGEEFRSWLKSTQEKRRDRNRRLAARLERLGVNVALEEVEALGRHLTGRSHFARLMVEKGYVHSVQEAFDLYLGERAPGYVARRGPSTVEAIRQVRQAGGMPVLAHPRRSLQGAGDGLEEVVSELHAAGLGGLEVYHSDHTPQDQVRLEGLAASLGLAATGGSDFHGQVKPGVELGAGLGGNLAIPYRVLEALRAGTV